jgi:hypothetical protein
MKLPTKTVCHGREGLICVTDALNIDTFIAKHS